VQTLLADENISPANAPSAVARMVLADDNAGRHPATAIGRATAGVVWLGGGWQVMHGFIGASARSTRPEILRHLGRCRLCGEAIRRFGFDDFPLGATFMIDFAHDQVPYGPERSSVGFGLHNAKESFAPKLLL